MIVPVIYPSAGDFWNTPGNAELINFAFNDRILTDLPPDYVLQAGAAEAREISARFDLPLPVVFWSSDAGKKRRLKTSIVKVGTKPFPPNSFVRIDFPGYEIYMASPELCFVQAAHMLDPIDLIMFGYELCSLYVPDSSGEFGQRSRIAIVTADQISKYIDTVTDFYAINIARRYIRHVYDNSNSPMETRLCIILTLPIKMGGFGMTDLELNTPVKISADAGKIAGADHLRADFCRMKNHRLLEYDSDLCHLKPAELARDANRKNAFLYSGYKVTTITSQNLKNYHNIENNLQILRKQFGYPDASEELELYREKRKALINRLFFVT